MTDEDILQDKLADSQSPFAPDGFLYAEVDDNHRLMIMNQLDAIAQNLPLVEYEKGYDGYLYEKGYAPQQTTEQLIEEQRRHREIAYENEVDPITAHIQRLRDEEQTEEIVAEINALIVERSEKVTAIINRYPYPKGK